MVKNIIVTGDQERVASGWDDATNQESPMMDRHLEEQKAHMDDDVMPQKSKSVVLEPLQVE